MYPKIPLIFLDSWLFLSGPMLDSDTQVIRLYDTLQSIFLSHSGDVTVFDRRVNLKHSYQLSHQLNDINKKKRSSMLCIKNRFLAEIG